MDREELRKAAASRRTDLTVEKGGIVWHCDFCSRDFVTEKGLMDHSCKERDKLELLKSPVGQAAYAHYSDWMRIKKRSVPPAETFMSSRQFNHFVKFTEWVAKTSVPNPQQFIRLMVESDTIPAMWCRDTTYALYLQWYDGAYSPELQFIQTYDALKRRAEDHRVTLKNVFSTYKPIELATAVRTRKLSPWLLITSPRFLEWIAERDPTSREIVSEAVNFNAYVQKLKDRPDLVKEFRRANELEGL